MSRSRAVVVAVGVAGALHLAVVPPAAAQDLAPTLTGEYFVENFSGTDINRFQPATCDPEGQSSFSFYSSGVAAGPYPGVYTEEGTVTFGPHTDEEVPVVPNPGDSGSFIPGSRGFGTAPVTSLRVEFTVDSVVGQVSGTKTITLTGAGARAYCAELSAEEGDLFPENPSGPADGYARGVIGTVAYEARIVTDTGVYGDSGTALLAAEDLAVLLVGGGGAIGGNFFEYFTSTQAATTPLLPTAKQQCRDGGWQSYGFRNQGDCVAFVATQARNEPGKNVPSS